MDQYKIFLETLKNTPPQDRSVFIKQTLNETIGQNSFGKFNSKHGMKGHKNLPADLEVRLIPHFRQRFKQRFPQMEMPKDWQSLLLKARCAKIDPFKWVSNVKIKGTQMRLYVIGKYNNPKSITIISAYRIMTKEMAKRILQDTGNNKDIDGWLVQTK